MRQFHKERIMTVSNTVLDHWLKRICWVAGSSAILWAVLGTSHLFSQSGAPLPASNTTMQVVSSATVNGGQQLVVLDQSLRSLAVYHVDVGGNVQLRSVRTLVWDLRMEEFNGQTPTPSELKRVQP
jgi:hypothetical protein